MKVKNKGMKEGIDILADGIIKMMELMKPEDRLRIMLKIDLAFCQFCGKKEANFSCNCMMGKM